MKLNQQTFHLTGKEFKTEDLLLLFEPETTYQIDRLADFLRSFVKKPFKLVISSTRRAKTREALGMYFGAIVPATAMDSLDLPYDVERIYDDFRYYRKLGKMSQKHLDITDDMLRVEWHYSYIKRIDGKLYRIPKELSNQDNGALLMLIEKVMEWRAQNGYPYIDVEKYKERRDNPELSTD